MFAAGTASLLFAKLQHVIGDEQNMLQCNLRIATPPLYIVQLTCPV